MFNAQRAAQPLVTMPICPDVKMKRLPFYDIMSELVKPSSLCKFWSFKLCGMHVYEEFSLKMQLLFFYIVPHGMNRSQEASFPFCLTPTQASDISESRDFVPITLGDQKLQYTVQVRLYNFIVLDVDCTYKCIEFHNHDIFISGSIKVLFIGYLNSKRTR